METTGKNGVCAVESMETPAIVLMGCGPDIFITANVMKGITYSEEGTYGPRSKRGSGIVPSLPRE